MTRRRIGFWVGIAAICTLLTLAGCARPAARRAVYEARPGLLRVGVTPDAPPVIYRTGERVAGLEADLARALGRELGREVRFIELPWEGQIPELVAGRTDIVMSGMSVTDTRSSDVAFADPYMVGGLMALVRETDVDRFAGPFAFITATVPVAVQAETTGDYFVRKYMKNAQHKAYDSLPEAFQALEAGDADMLIHDAPVVWHLAAEGTGSGIAVARPRLTVEYYAWALSRDRDGLLDAVNAVLDKWQSDGTLERSISEWIPLAD